MLGIIITIGLVVFVIVVIADIEKNRRNPSPLMSNGDKRFFFVNNVKTRNMYECIKR